MQSEPQQLGDTQLLIPPGVPDAIRARVLGARSVEEVWPLLVEHGIVIVAPSEPDDGPSASRPGRTFMVQVAAASRDDLREAVNVCAHRTRAGAGGTVLRQRAALCVAIQLDSRARLVGAIRRPSILPVASRAARRPRPRRRVGAARRVGGSDDPGGDGEPDLDHAHRLAGAGR